MRPIVAALTDGSGHTERSRLEISRKMLMDNGAALTNLYGISTDREIYSRILAKDYDFFISLSESLAAMLFERKIECVAGDAIEGYNPSHDLCRYLINRAVRTASIKLGYSIDNYRFPLVGHPSTGDITDECIKIVLTPDEIDLKLSAAQKYTESVGGTLASEVKESLAKYGEDAFGTEILYSEKSDSIVEEFIQQPFYELYGEQQVKAGFYTFVIRYHEHIAPIIKALA